MRHSIKVIFILLAVSIILILTACNTEDTGLSGIGGVDGLALTIRSSQSRVKVGDTVQIQLTAKNTRQQPIVLECNEKPVLDIVVVAAPIGNIIRSWSVENPDKVSHRIEWKPGESQVLEMVWNVSTDDKLGIRIGISGLVNYDSKVQSAGVMLCLEGYCQ